MHGPESHHASPKASSSLLPILAITLGDPAGIGPEIIVKALQEPTIFERCRPLIIGDVRILARAADQIGVPALDLDIVTSADTLPDSAAGAGGTVAAQQASAPRARLLDLHNADPAQIAPGQVAAQAGRAAAQYVVSACDLAMAGRAHAVVTAPLNKEAMHLGGYNYPGHTELLAERTGATRVSMLLVAPQLRVVHVSTHVALHEAIQRVRTPRVLEVIELAQQSCRALGIEKPRIAVAGLNPHAGEGGLFGNEEQQHIEPAIIEARARGLDVGGPVPPDTVFLRAVKGEYDIVVAMYHDQGHIPMKLLAFDSGVNVSMGLPIIRTSVDHGTAFDIAGTGKASEASLLAAIDIAINMSTYKLQST